MSPMPSYFFVMMSASRAITALVVISLILPACTSPVPDASEPPPSREATTGLLDHLQALTDRIVAGGAPAAMLAIRDDGALLIAAAGEADIESGRPLSGSQQFRIGSVTKTFVGALVMMLVADGKLGLDDTVEQWWPGTLPNGDQITVRMLLNHTSGLFDYVNESAVFEPYHTNPGHMWKPEQLVGFAVEEGPLFAPGTSWAYSNTNYIVLGRVLEAAGGDPLAAQLRDRIFEPLDLHDTYLAEGVEFPADGARGYIRNPAGHLTDVTPVNPSQAWAAGAIVSTASDTTAFFSALLMGALVPSDSLSSMLETIPVATDDVIDAYGLGIYEHDDPCQALVGHDGEIFGYQTFVLASPDGSRVLLSMTTHPDRPWWLDTAVQMAFCGSQDG